MSSYVLHVTPDNDTISPYKKMICPFGEMAKMVFRLITLYREAIFPYDNMKLPTFHAISPPAEATLPCVDVMKMVGSYAKKDGNNVSPSVEMSSPYADAMKMVRSCIK